MFTATVPKPSEVGLTETPAWTGTGETIRPTSSNPENRYTRSVLRIHDRSSVFG